MTEPASLPISSLQGLTFPSEAQAGVRYRLLRRIGEGAMGVAFLAMRESPEGESVVVVKFVNPNAVESDVSPEIFAHKEAIALKRLNEHVPPCPFVVRFVDAGTAPIFDERPIPWLAIEYVHGGVEGTTLEGRVNYAVKQTGFAFDPVRAGHAIRCLAAGLTAVHAVDVIHRDLTPGNVLCCGFGASEIFKISDFGVARSQGSKLTFAGFGVGTTGYAAPEQCFPGEVALEPYTDVFAMACVVYYLLTGREYFDAPTPLAVYDLVCSPARAKLADSPHLSPELRDRPEACDALDEILSRATSQTAALRPQSAEALSAELLSWIEDAPSAPHSSRRLVNAIVGRQHRSSHPESWTWNVKQQPRENFVVRSAAWDTDGHCFALTARGPRFWDGNSWLDASALNLPRDLVFTQRYEAGGWLVGGAGGLLGVCNNRGLTDVLRWHDAAITFHQGSGRFDSLFVAVGAPPEGPPSLYCISARRWLRPLLLDGVQHVSSLVRLDDLRWLVGGRLESAEGFVALYSPIEESARLVPTPRVRAFVAGASAYERDLALVVGSNGVVLRMEGDRAASLTLDGGHDLSAAALDMLGREWVSSVGTLWTRAPETDPIWSAVWREPRLEAPFVSLMADAGLLVAMTVDGCVVEGRDSS